MSIEQATHRPTETEKKAEQRKKNAQRTNCEMSNKFAYPIEERHARNPKLTKGTEQNGKQRNKSRSPAHQTEKSTQTQCVFCFSPENQAHR